MTKRNRILALILASLMLLSAAACSDSGTNEETAAITAGDTAAEITETEPVPEETGPVAELPDKTYDGEEVMFLTSHNSGYDWYSSYEIYAEEMTGQLINDAVFTRNNTIEELLDIKIAQTKLENCHTTAKSSITAGDKQFDVVMPYMNNTITLAVEGSLLDLKQIPYLDLDKPWWDTRANKDLIINDRLFITTGDISILDNECTMVMFFNKDMIGQFGLESPYDLVKEYGWTIDKVNEMAHVVTNDKDGDGKMTNDDMWGISIADNAPISFYFGAGERVVQADDNGELQLMLGSNRAIDVFDKITNLCYSTEVLSRHTTGNAGFDSVCASFNAGNIMFVTFALVDINGLRDAEFEFGILPYPLYDETQKEYNNLISTGLVSSTSIPNTCENTEVVGVTLEAMAYYSTSTLTPAYYDNALKTRYVRDEESGEMLDIIFATRVYDLGFIFNWGNAGSMVTNMYTAKQTEYASNWEKIQKAATKAMGKALEQFAEIP
ncbi:MAG: extracellular solute-binding protein [Ruminococcaceae bacterium]|nr:extracellular solute-binding protein [Oscillospiraceae bacterium]